MDNKVKTTIDATDTRPGYRFGILSAIPGMLAAGAIILGAPVVGVMALALAGTVAAGAGAGALAADLDYRKKYSPKKIFRGVLGGSVLGAALTYGAAVNAPQAPVPAEKSAPPSTLTIAPQGGDLCRDFKLSENTTATAGTDAQGQTTYTLTVPKGCALTP